MTTPTPSPITGGSDSISHRYHGCSKPPLRILAATSSFSCGEKTSSVGDHGQKPDTLFNANQTISYHMPCRGKNSFEPPWLPEGSWVGSSVGAEKPAWLSSPWTSCERYVPCPAASDTARDEPKDRLAEREPRKACIFWRALSLSCHRRRTPRARISETCTVQATENRAGGHQVDNAQRAERRSHLELERRLCIL